jgi:choline dehydrogenase-like flavoprotein
MRPNSDASTVIKTDVCIVGAGPAGLTIARVLAAAGIRVVLLEGGDGEGAQLRQDVRASGDDLYPSSNIGGTRAAMLGGTAGLWSYLMSNEDRNPQNGPRGARYAPLNPIDFEQRPEIANSGWPLSRADLDPWYAKAQQISGLGAYSYDADHWSTPDRRSLRLDPELIETQMYQLGSSTAWTVDAVRALREQPNVQILTDANVVRLEADSTGSQVTAVHYRHPGGANGLIQARTTVLAAGGVDNSRLLLMSDHEVRGGLGNQHDQVGRYWMEHPQVRAGMLVAPPNTGLADKLRLYDAWWAGDDKVMGKLSVAPEAMRREGLLSTSTLLVARDDVFAGPAFQAYTAVRSPSGRAAALAERAKLGAKAALGIRDLLAARAVIDGQPGPDLSGWASRANASAIRVFEIIHVSEQSPEPDNRIMLTGELDGHGRRIPILNWQWSQEDRRRVTRSRDLHAEAFAKAGLGEVIQGDWDSGQPRMVGGCHHHLGGTRMSSDPATGVVDVNSKVHGMTNLFAAGSSVFPSGGSVSPTLTVVALSVRLAEHLRDTLRQVPAPVDSTLPAGLNLLN